MPRKLLLGFFLAIMTLLLFSATAFAMDLSLQYGNPAKTLALTAEPTDTVGEVKAKFETEYHMDASALVLSFNSVIMEDSSALADYGVTTGCRLDVQFSVQTMTFGTESIFGNSASAVYFGSYGGSPLLWQVLDNHNAADATTRGNEDSLLLLSENVLETEDFASLPGWNQRFYLNNFSAGEKGAIVPSKQRDSSGVLEVDSTVFQLSAKDMENPAYGFVTATDRTATDFRNRSQKVAWWTRNALTNNATAVSAKGELNAVPQGETLGVRPALNLEKNKVAFASLAKSSELKNGAALEATTVSQAQKNTAWKLTLRDTENQTLSLGKTEKKGNLLSLAYSNAPVGPKQYVSAMITDATGSQILYYGKLKNTAGANSSEGTVSLLLPSDFFDSGLQLKLFSEKCNDGKHTDFAGALQGVAVSENSAKKLMAYGIPEGQGDAVIDTARGTVRLTVAPDTDLRNLTASFEVSADAGVYVNGVPQISGETVNDFSKPVVYMVVAENDSTRNYTVTVKREVSGDAALSSFWIEGAAVTPPFTDGVYNYTAKVSGNTSAVTLTAIANDCRATVGGDLGIQQIAPGFNEFMIEVSAEDGVTKTQYSLTILRGTPTENPFADVSEEDWFYKDVLDAYDAGIISGVSASSFAPAANLTRGMTMMLLYQLDGAPAVSGELLYSDVTSSSWYSNAILWAEKRKIAEGFEDGTFHPDEVVTREQFSSFLHRYVVYQGNGNGIYNELSLFSDVDAVAPWALKDVQWCVGNGYILGTGDYTTLRPKDATTRAEGVSACLKVLDETLSGE